MRTAQLNHPNSLDPISEIVAMLAHQINSPLSCILASAELSIRHVNDEIAVRKHCDNIIKCADMIRDLNKKILEIEKSCQFRTETIAPAALLDKCLDAFKDLYEVNHITVEKEYDCCPPLIRCNPFGLEQVFNNLILNALDAMSEVAYRRLLVAVKGDPGIGVVSIWIRDSGPGIPDNILSRIFLPNFTTKKSGNGLGLSICKYIVEKHHGKIEVVSRESRGTSFGIHIPVNNSPKIIDNPINDQGQRAAMEQETGLCHSY
ncbi:MAG: HAMP domain-containing histidine kinase [Deltaproteobacteria bacterium]|nr:HAMP domain-containing histidine kinase [Deltaproteobacteria bacterium]